MPSNEVRKNRKLARLNYSSSMMSDTKWRTLIAAVSDKEVGVKQIIVKFIDHPQERKMQLPWLAAPYALVDSIEFGPFPLLYIEWLEFPRIVLLARGKNLADKSYVQDIDAIRSAIQSTGKLFPLEEYPKGLRVIGHTPRKF